MRSPDHPPSPAVPVTAAKPSSRTKRRLIAIVLLIAAAVLAGFAARTFLRVESVHETVNLTPLEDARELTARKRDVVGSYATGAANGDRTITVRSDGGIEFGEIGADPATSRIQDTWSYGRRAKKFALATTQGGIVDIVNIDTLEYFGDTYRRTK